MAKVFATLIMNGRKTLDDVPTKLRTEVEAILKEMGHDATE